MFLLKYKLSTASTDAGITLYKVIPGGCFDLNPNNAREDLWRQAKTVKEKFKQHAQTQDAILCKLHCVKYDKGKCCVSTMMRFMSGVGGHKAPRPPRYL